MKPLDEASSYVEAEKDKCEDKISETEHLIQAAIEERERKINEIEQVESKKNALIEEKTGLHGRMDKYKEDYPEELEQFYEDEKFKEDMIQLRSQNKRIKDRVKWLDSRRKETREKIKKVFNKNAKLVSKRDSLRRELAALGEAEMREIVRMEKYFKDVSEDLGTSELQNLIDKVALDLNYSISNKIVANQLAQIEKEQYDHIMEFNTREERTNSHIAELQTSIFKLKSEVSNILEQQNAGQKITKAMRQTLQKWKTK